MLGLIEWWGANNKTQSNAGRVSESWGERRNINAKHEFTIFC